MKTLARNVIIHLLRIFCSLSLIFAMSFVVLAQEAAPDDRPDIPDWENVTKINADPEKATTFRLNVIGSDALIYGLIVGRGSGAISTNTALGGSALISNTSGDRNTAVGSDALRSNTLGAFNTAVGRWALRYNVGGNYNVGIGFIALRDNRGHHNTAVGNEALVLNTTGHSNVAVGTKALLWNTDRSNLVAVGDSALHNNGRNTSEPYQAIRNTALGSKALFANTIGSHNTAIGALALYSNVTGIGNTGNGSLALFYNTTGDFNTANGTMALYNNTTGKHNTAFGYGALYHLNTGDNNTAIGLQAGGFRSNISQGTFVGRDAYPSVNDLTNVTGIGYNVRPGASNQVRIGNTAVTSIGGHAAWSNVSDERFKNNIEENVAGLDFILKLRPVTYNLEVDKLAKHLKEDIAMDESDETAEKSFDSNMKARAEKSAIRYTGFLATEVEAAAKSIGYDFSGVDAPQNAESLYSLRYAEFVVPIVKAIQEQQQQIETLSPEGIDALREELCELRLANEQLLAAEVSLRAENVRMQGQINDILSVLESFGVEMQDCCQQTTGRSPGTSSLNQMPDNARLEQNTPNPFHENTLIRYFLPEGTHRAQIIITDMGGTQVMALPLEHQGAGQVLIHGGTLPSGAYVYTLTVDGRKVDSKRMVLL